MVESQMLSSYSHIFIANHPGWMHRWCVWNIYSTGHRTVESLHSWICCQLCLATSQPNMEGYSRSFHLLQNQNSLSAASPYTQFLYSCMVSPLWKAQTSSFQHLLKIPPLWFPFTFHYSWAHRIVPGVGHALLKLYLIYSFAHWNILSTNLLYVCGL